MIPNRSNRPSVSGLVLALVALGGLAGLSGAVPSVPVVLQAPRPDQSTALPPPADPQATADAASMVAPCRVIARPYVLAADDTTIRVLGQVQNVGPLPATIDAVQVGWGGPATLAAIVLGTGAAIPVAATASPALVPLAEAGAAAIEPGGVLDVALTFELPAPDATWAPGPIAVLLHEGCEVALRPAVADSCPLVVERPVVDPAAPEVVLVGVANAGDEPVDLAMLELTWPVAENGPLAGIRLGEGQVVVPLDPILARSPGALDIGRWLGESAKLKPGADAVLALRFEHAAAATGYSISLTTRHGCLTTVSDWVAKPDCGLELRDFEPHGHAGHVKLLNRVGISQTLGVFDVFWSPEINGPLAQVLVDGKVVWDAGSTVSPATIRTFQRPVVIGPDASADVQLRFDPKNAAPMVVERRAGVGDDDPGPVAGGELGGDFTLLAGFDSGCQATFSTLRGDAGGCRVWAAEELAHREGAPENEVSASVLNSGSSALLRSLVLTWPERNGALTGVFLGATSLLAKPQAPGPVAFELRLEGANAVLVPRGTPARLRLTFARPAADGGYHALLGLADVAGRPCTEVAVSSPPATPECGMLSFDPVVRISGRYALLKLRNDSLDPLQISDLRIDWPRLQGMSLLRLNTVRLEDGPNERTIWSFDPALPLPTPPVTVRPNPIAGSATLRATSEVTLRLGFNANLQDTAEFRDALRAVVGFVEGCRVAFPPEGTRVTSRTFDFAGVIRDFPKRGESDTLFGCCWRIYDDRRATEQLVEVDPHSRFQPVSARPKRGDIVQVSTLVSPEGKLYARQIIFRTQRPEETVIGPIDKLDPPDVAPPDVPQHIGVNGDTVAIGERTDIPDVFALRIGARVAVRGIRTGRDTLDAIRVEALDTQSGNAVVVEGAVYDVLDGAEPGIRSVWLVDHQLIQIPDGVTIQGLPPGGKPGLGWEARIDGTQVDDVIRATGGQVLPPPEMHKLEGVLLTVPPGGLVGDWSIRTGAGVATFTVESSAVVNTRAAPVAPGMKVFAVVQGRGGEAPVAVSVRMEWP